MLSVSNILSNAFRVYQRTFSVHTLGMLIVFFIGFALYFSLVPVLFEMSLDQLSALFKEGNIRAIEGLLSKPSVQLKLAVFELLLYCMAMPLTAGFYKNFDNVLRGNRATLQVLFSYYRSVYTARILGYTVLVNLLKKFLSYGLIYLGWDAFSFWIPLFVSIVFVLTVPFIIFQDKSLRDAMAFSYKKVLSSIFTIFLLLSLGFMISMLGILVLGIGIVFTFPFLYAIIYAIYREISV